MQVLPQFTLPRLLAIALLGFCAPAVSFAGEAAAPEDHTADFKTLTVDFTRLDALYATYNDPVYKVTTSGYISLLKQRATQLGWTPPKGMAMGSGGGRGDDGGGGYGRRGAPKPPQFDQVRFDELRYDINLQYQRIATYLAPLRTPPLAPQGERVVEIAISELHPNPANPADVKAALDVLDREIKRMEIRASAMMIGSPSHEAETARISRVKQRRALLGKQFTEERWNELIGDMSGAG